MRIKLQNRYLVPLIPFLESLRLKGEQSRARSKFLTLASEAFTSLHQSELELIKEYAVLDDQGEPEMAEDGSFTLREDVSSLEYAMERNKLFLEIAEIEGGTYTSHLETMWQILSDYDEELDGETAQLYDALCNAFEEAIDHVS